MTFPTGLTDNSKRIFISANQEAQGLGHEYMGTEHLLLALAKSSYLPEPVVKALNLKYETVLVEVEKVMKRGEAVSTRSFPVFPATDKARRAIYYAREFAGETNLGSTDYLIEPENILFGLAKEETSVAARVLYNLNPDSKLDDVKRTVVKALAQRGFITNALAYLQSREFTVVDSHERMNRLAKCRLKASVVGTYWEAREVEPTEPERMIVHYNPENPDAIRDAIELRGCLDRIHKPYEESPSRHVAAEQLRRDVQEKSTLLDLLVRSG